MHELALAGSMLDIAREELARHGCSVLRLLRVELGALSGVETDSLRFGFEAQVRGSVHEGAVLDIVHIPLRLRCGVCGAEFEGERGPGLLSACPSCGEVFGHAVLSGREMRVVWIEGD